MLGLNRLVVVFSLALSGCGLCGEQVLSRTRSPDGRAEVTVLVRDCGATTSEFSLIEIREIRWWQRPVVIASAKYAQTVRVKWIDSVHLQIKCETCTHARMLQDMSSWATRDGERISLDFQD